MLNIKRKKGQKYHNSIVEFQGQKFASKREMQRYIFLKEEEDKGLISDLKCQVKYELIPAIKEKEVVHLKTKDKIVERTVQLAITYTCDYQYIKEGKIVVEDVKASPNLAALDKAFLIKEKLFRWKYGFSIKRVYKANEEI